MTEKKDDLPTTKDTAALMAGLIKQSQTDQKLLALIVNELITNPIKDTTIRQVWENFAVRKLEPIFTNNVMITRAGMVRLTIAFNRPVTLIAYINNAGMILNNNSELSAGCMYVFDVPLNPNDALNLSASFDDTDQITAQVIHVRLQEVR